MDGEALDSQAAALWALWKQPHGVAARMHAASVPSEPPQVDRGSPAVQSAKALVRLLVYRGLDLGPRGACTSPLS